MRRPGPRAPRHALPFFEMAPGDGRARRVRLLNVARPPRFCWRAPRQRRRAYDHEAGLARPERPRGPERRRARRPHALGRRSRVRGSGAQRRGTRQGQPRPRQMASSRCAGESAAMSSVRAAPGARRRHEKRGAGRAAPFEFVIRTWAACVGGLQRVGPGVSHPARLPAPCQHPTTREKCERPIWGNVREESVPVASCASSCQQLVRRDFLACQKGGCCMPCQPSEREAAIVRRGRAAIGGHQHARNGSK
jgi:hypothetical protein